MQVCASCNGELPDGFSFCGYCGAPLRSASPVKESRKTVTVLFSDLKGSTNLGEALDSESLREVMSRYFEVMQRIIEEHGGAVEKFIGDAVMAVFGLRELHEDDALRAVRAAAETKTALAELNQELARRWGVTLTNRTGVNTGGVVAGEPVPGQRLVTGDAVNVAARLEQAAPPTEILIGELTYRLVREAVEVEPVEPLALKGKSERVAAYRLLSVTGAEPLRRRHDRPMVGREEELGHLRQELQRAVEQQQPRMVTVLGQPGVGKSRLLAALRQAVEPEAQMVLGRCLPYGRGITFWPLLEIVQDAASIAEDDPSDVARSKLAELAGERRDDETAAVVDRVASAVGLSAQQFPVEETFWGARKLIEAMAARRPLVVVLEDIHWAEMTFLDMVDHVLSSGGGPLLIVCLARHELLEVREDWVDAPRSSRVSLEPLSDADIGRIVETLLGTDAVAPEVRARIVEAAGGNPLFVEQMLSMMIDDGQLRHEDGRWVLAVGGAEVLVPPSMQALLAARLDHLQDEERGVLEPAAVVGLVFPQGAVEELADEALRSQVGVRLSSLSAKELVHAAESAGAGDDGFRFHHILIRDAAYGRLLKRDRAVLHERFVEWGERVNRERRRESEFEEIHGYHLEQAYVYLSELGPLDAHGKSIGVRAAERLAAAGRKALARGDMPAAANLLRRASALLPKHDLRRLELLPEVGEALMEAGEFAPAEVFLDEAIEATTATGEARLRARAVVARLLVGVHSAEPERWSGQLVDELDKAIEVLEEARDHAGLAAAYRLQSWALGTGGNSYDAARPAVQAMEHARAAGDDRRWRRAACSFAQLIVYGPHPVSESIAECERIVEQSKGDKRTEGLVLHLLSRLYAMRGDFEHARSLYTRSRLTLEETGRTVVAAATSLDSCCVEMLAGDPAAAERELRRDYGALEEMGEKFILSTVAGELAQAVYAQGRYDEAERLTRTTEELAAEDDVDSEALWRSVRGKVLARRGELEAARTTAQEAVDLMRDSGALTSEADALRDLAEVLELSRLHAEARATLEEAHQLYERKGDVVSASSVAAAIGSLPEEPATAGA